MPDKEAPKQDDTQHANWLFAGECQFVAGAATEAQIPSLPLPEIAFVGRSNVGKSSLVNALTGRKTLARVSGTPGCTRQINFFALREKLMLVDLPGYGYAKVSRSEVSGWSRMILNYLKGRRNLHRICVLIDSRRGLLEKDEKLMDILDEAAISYQVVLTKIDKISQEKIKSLVDDVKASSKRHTALFPTVMMTSSQKKDGIEELRVELAQFVERQD